MKYVEVILLRSFTRGANCLMSNSYLRGMRFGDKNLYIYVFALTLICTSIKEYWRCCSTTYFWKCGIVGHQMNDMLWYIQNFCKKTVWYSIALRNQFCTSVFVGLGTTYIKAGVDWDWCFNYHPYLHQTNIQSD